MKKTIIILAIIIFAWIFIRFVIGGSEDDWICVEGEWVKHGVPAAPKPISGCGDESKEINSFSECLEAGYAIMESYPRQCRTPEGNFFVEELDNLTEGFCGFSTNFSCSTSDDCLTAGCSGQICMGKDEDPIATTCEWRNCYDETMYDLSCQCLNSQCQWSK